jgi:trehalose 6-phosphate phosphatase
VDPLAPLRRTPAGAAIFVDFDGTLAAIVAAADAARPLPGVPELLRELAAAYGVVAVVSGRPVSFLRAHLPQEVELHGLYGLESVVAGQPSTHPDAAPWRAVIDQVAASADALAEAGVDVEHKGLSLTLHYRQHPDLAEAAVAWASEAADRSGLHLRRAKMSLELHPPVAVDKGSVVEARAAGCSAAMYVGDDVGDLPAFEALDRLRARGVASIKVAVRTPDASPLVLAEADVLVDGPQGAVTLLRGLL